MTLHAIDCSTDEIEELTWVGEENVRAVEELTAGLLGVRQEMPGVSALCFGESAVHDWLPEPVRSIARSQYGPGVWVRSLKFIMVFLRRPFRVDAVVLHELAHALQDLLSDRFPFPMALTEGFACMCEIGYATRRGSERVIPRVWGRGSAAGGLLTPDEYMSIRNLLHFEYSDPSDGGARHGKFLQASYWFVGFLQHAFFESRPHVRRIMIELRRDGIKTPKEVIAWLERTCDRSLDQMEEDFRRFCTGRG